MAITLFRIKDFRNLSEVELVPCSRGLNIVYGDNGSGKTSLLESIYYLSLGRSFRTSLVSSLIRHSSEKFSLFAQLLNDAERHIPIGMERNLSGVLHLRCEEKEATTITELTALLPIRIINCYSYQLLESGPAFRRKYLDWGLFYQTNQFLPCWRAYERALKQRNVILRNRRPKKELDVWTMELVKYGEELTKFRRDYVQTLSPFVIEMAKELLSLSHLEINYRVGWDETMDLTSALAHSYDYELRSGRTQWGPHRSDLDISINGLAAKHFLSRGQQKLLICAMILAQGLLLSRDMNKKLIYLVDDLPSELDWQSKRKLISLLSRQQTQVFITAIESKSIYELMSDESELPIKVFHVKHGNVTVSETSSSW